MGDKFDSDRLSLFIWVEEPQFGGRWATCLESMLAHNSGAGMHSNLSARQSVQNKCRTAKSWWAGHSASKTNKSSRNSWKVSLQPRSWMQSWPLYRLRVDDPPEMPVGRVQRAMLCNWTCHAYMSTPGRNAMDKICTGHRMHKMLPTKFPNRCPKKKRFI